MKKNTFFLMGVLAVLLTFGVVQQVSAQIKPPAGFVGVWSVESKSEAARTLNSAGIREFFVIEIGENGTFRVSTKYYTDNEASRAALRSQGVADTVNYTGNVTAGSASQVTITLDKPNQETTIKLSGQSLVWDAMGLTFAKGEPNPNRR